MTRPPMTHLPGFWDAASWDDAHWAEYLRRQAKKGHFAEWIDQALHRLMGLVMSRAAWEAREAGQWPSGTGSYDACADHIAWCQGAGLHREAEALRAEARRRRAGFMA